MKALALSTLLIAASPASSLFGLREKVESLLFNPREQTVEGLEALESGAVDDATQRFDTATRLAPEDPLVRFNAGTAHLTSGDVERASMELERAANIADTELKSRALYNLGNTRLVAEDPAGAIEAYKESLRSRPDQPDTKFNLELALRKLEEQRSGQGDGQESPDSENQGDREQSSEEGAEQPPDEPQPQDGNDRSNDPDQQDPQQFGDQSSDQTLPQFETQPDMTPEQAAAILEAVENLEREQRLKNALEQLRKSKKGDRDW